MIGAEVGKLDGEKLGAEVGKSVGEKIGADVGRFVVGADKIKSVLPSLYTIEYPPDVIYRKYEIGVALSEFPQIMREMFFGYETH